MTVATFLKKVAKLAEEGNIEIVENKKNMQTKRKYNLTTEDQEDMIKQLEPSDLIKGPVLDRDIIKEEVWIFKKKYDNIKVLIYIKLKIRDNKECICLSIHEDEEVN